ncbi:MmcQ/YjbR family DNA-binding protein [Paracoccus aerodenitrificans]|uniref:MmcQ/YjbR family DNA-binding protein n=1 Tax=Paracoccus aerodenitrificans TaxID=3017781 RepID=UPI0022F0BF3A|nr:MmcQ/YjbR family DNA-binding protein [Paracoccus aerodenitrificans]WBU63068.1 MmcQ/YjbR family DNA-binding protein [Paracoccus aerodenitrificans]
MSRAQVNHICAGFPGAEHSDPWGGGHDCWKVGNKIFALIGMREDRVSVKCRDIDTAAMLIEAGVAVKAPYMHRSWVALPCDAPPDELEHRIAQSYELIRSSLPKKLQAGLANGV